MSNTVRVVIAPWGDPFGWQEAKYLFKPTAGNQIGPIKAYTTLDVWLRFINQDNGDKICVIVPDTVLDRKYHNKEYFKEFADRGYCYYKGVVKKSVCGYLRDKVKNYDSDLVKVYVNYNTGAFGNLKFEREASDYYLNLFWIFYKFFFEDLRILELINKTWSEKLNLEVYLDTTHGVNFMPTLTLKALKTFLEALSAAPIKITLKVYNAEPVVPFNSNEVSEFLEIHEETFEKVFTQLRFLSEDKRQWIMNNRNFEKYEEVLKFLTGVIKGYPLLIFNNFDLNVKNNGTTIEKLNKNFIQQMLDKYEKRLKLKIDSSNLYRYPHNTPEFIREVIPKLRELDKNGLIHITLEWKKEFLRLNIDKLYENSPMESYVTQNIESTFNDICRGIPENRVLLKVKSLFNRKHLINILNSNLNIKKLLRNFQSHLGLKVELVELETLEPIETDKNNCRNDVSNNKEKILLYYEGGCQ